MILLVGFQKWVATDAALRDVFDLEHQASDSTKLMARDSK
jgi:hypothetical protein